MANDYQIWERWSLSDDSPEVRKVVMRYLSESAYQSAKANNTVKAYRDFLEKYPSTPYSIEALGKLDSLLAVSFSRLCTAKDFVEFAQANDGTDLADRAIDELYRKVMDEDDVQAALLFMRHFSLDPRYTDVYRRYYTWHSQEGCHQLIELFSQNNPDYPFMTTVSSDLNEAADIEVTNLSERFDESNIWNYKEIVKTFPDKRISHVALQRMLQNYIAAGDWKSAIGRCESLKSYCQGYNKSAYESLYGLLSSPYDSNKEPVAMKIDSKKVLNVVMAPSGRAVYYTRQGNAGKREVCYAELDGGKWVSRGKIVIDGCECDDIECFSLFRNGEKMLIGMGGDILVAEGSNMQWHVAEIPPYPVNTDYIETDAFMLPDGSGMLLASDRPEGYNVQMSGMYYHGDNAMASDIWYVPFTTQGWGEPVNLGFKINTCYCERYPVMSQDMKTLFFVSDRGGGLGYGDIYMAHRTDVTDWRHWSQILNLGIETNSPFAESGLSLLPDGRGLLFSSAAASEEGQIFRASVNIGGTDGFTALKIIGEEGLSDFVYCGVYDTQSGEKTRLDFDGLERVAYLQNGRVYAVSAIQKHHWLPMFEVVGGQKQQVAISGVPVSEINGKQYPLSGLRFKNVDSDITPLGRVELEQLCFFMRSNPSVEVGIIVDYPGSSTSQCHENSLKLGDRIRAYLVSLGVEGDRLTVIGRGNLNGRTESSGPSVSVRFSVR